MDEVSSARKFFFFPTFYLSFSQQCQICYISMKKLVLITYLLNFQDIFMGCMECIVSASTFAAKQLYSGELGCRTAVVHGLYPILTYGSKKSHRHCKSHTLFNGINLAKMCESCQIGLPIRPIKGSISPQHACTKWLSTNHQPECRSYILKINDFTSDWRNF